MLSLDLGPPPVEETGPPVTPLPVLPQCFTYAEVATAMKVTKQTIMEWVRLGRVPSPTYIGCTARFSPAQLEQIISGPQAAGTFPVAPSPRAETMGRVLARLAGERGEKFTTLDIPGTVDYALPPVPDATPEPLAIAPPEPPPPAPEVAPLPEPPAVPETVQPKKRAKKPAAKKPAAKKPAAKKPAAKKPATKPPAKGKPVAAKKPAPKPSKKKGGKS